MKICTIPLCGRKIHGKGLCNMHCSRKRAGLPLMTFRETFIYKNPPKNGIGLIPLTQGKIAIVDEIDYRKLIKYKWSADRSTNNKNVWYAKRCFKMNGVWRHMRMSKEILGIPYKSKKMGDHKNHDTLDNRRSNLRKCTHVENTRNCQVNRTNKLGLKGVCPTRNGTYKAQIRAGKHIYLGTFKTKEEAYKAYCQAAKKYHKDFANF